MDLDAAPLPCPDPGEDDTPSRELAAPRPVSLDGLPRARLGLLGRSRLLPALRGRALTVRLRRPGGRTIAHEIAGRARRVGLPVTFTPFASAKPCSARCRFCSETLRHRDSRRLAASLRAGPGWGDRLGCVLRDLRSLPMGLSLSGLEATDDVDWLRRVVKESRAHEAAGGCWTDKVLYSNAAGLLGGGLEALKPLGLDRFELSRHHEGDAANNWIMRFRDDVAVRHTRRWLDAAHAARRLAEVRLVCVLQKAGVSGPEGANRYLQWASDHGLHDVVFRELARLGDAYRDTAGKRYADDARAPAEPVAAALLADDRFEPTELVAGYYFWTLRGRWRGHTTVAVEASDYVEMKERHDSDVIHKLILFGDGTLGADWDPDRQVLSR